MFAYSTNKHTDNTNRSLYTINGLIVWYMNSSCKSVAECENIYRDLHPPGCTYAIWTFHESLFVTEFVCWIILLPRSSMPTFVQLIANVVPAPIILSPEMSQQCTSITNSLQVFIYHRKHSYANTSSNCR